MTEVPPVDAATPPVSASGDADDPAAAPYPSRWEADVALTDGGTMHVRPVRPDDGPLVERFHERQSPESIYFRFFSPRPRLSARDLERFTHVDYVDRMAFVGIIGDELVGIARYDRHRARSDAEVAFFIDDDHHGRGVATVLLEYLAVAARESGISGFTASVLPQNRKMLGVFTHAGFEAHSRFEEGIIEVELAIDPTPEALAAIDDRARRSEARSVERLLRPHSVAVVGASRSEGTIGYQVFHHLVSRRFEGPVYPVNPGADYVSSVRAWDSVLDVPGELDLAVICVPADQVMGVVQECAVRRVQGLIVISSGFADKDDAGERLEHDLVTLARRHGMRLIGPNCLGVINTSPEVRLHATFADVDPLPGRIGLSAQSGTIGAAIIQQLRTWGLGISSFVAVGNKADVSGNDLLRYWQDDADTDVVLLYLESFGNPRRFSRIAREVSRAKPIVAVKVGRGVGDSAEPSDWPSDASVGAMLDQSGVIRVDTLTQMFHTASVLTRQTLPAGPRVAVLTNSWGPAFLATDALEGAGLVLAEPSEVTRKALDALVPGGSRSPNPYDLSNGTAPEVFGEALRLLAADPDVDSVLVIYAPGIHAEYAEVSAAVLRGAADGSATVVACLLGDHPTGLLDDGTTIVPEFPFPEEAALALARVTGYASWRAKPVGDVLELDGDAVERARALVGGALEANPDGVRLGPLDADRLVRTAGMTLVDQRVVDGGDDDVVAAARELGYPVAVKAGGLVQLSRTEAGGVSLDVHGDDEVRRAHTRMSELLGPAMTPTVVQRMLPEGLESRIALHRHPVLGDVISLGAGGSVAEQFDGLALHILPLTDCDADRLITAATIGSAVDALGPGARAALADVLLRLSALAECVPEIAGVRLNPVLVSADGHAEITDVRIDLLPVPPDTRPPVRRL